LCVNKHANTNHIQNFFLEGGNVDGCKTQPENRTVPMDKYHLSSAPMPELQWLIGKSIWTGIQRTQIWIMAGSQCLFAPNTDISTSYCGTVPLFHYQPQVLINWSTHFLWLKLMH